MTANMSNGKKSLVFAAVTGGVVALSAFAAYKYYCSKYRYEKGDVCDDDADEIIDESQAADDRRVLVLGLSGAGKTSLLANMSKQNITKAPEPTDGFNIVSINSDKNTLNVWEVGGSDNVRAHWANFTYGTHILVYVVDSSDTDKFTQAGVALQAIIKEDNLKNVPIIIVANKQDVPNATSPDEVMSALRLTPSVESQHRVTVVGTAVPLSSPAVGVAKLEDMFHT